jgi:molybdopterin/thiamine biosynthesis adenylyltransferase
MLKYWWERWQGRLDHELKELDDAGIAYELDEGARSNGVIRLNVSPAVNGITLKLVVNFPDLYPYFRFEISAPTLDLKHHQHPFAKNLCLIGRSTWNWHSTDTVASFLKNRLSLVLQAAQSESATAVAAIEERQGEPYSDYYPYRSGPIILIDSGWSLPSTVHAGKLILAVSEGCEDIIRGAVMEVEDRNHVVIANHEPSLQSIFQKKIIGRWIRIAEPIHEADPAQFLKLLRDQEPELLNPLWQNVDNFQFDVIGVVFGEETQWRTISDGWVFLVQVKNLNKYGRRIGIYFARAGRAGHEDLQARVPELTGMQRQRIAIFGLGGLGAPSAIEFAKSGIGKMNVIDHDFVDSGTVIRWPLGISNAGLFKTAVLATFIRQQYPYTQVVTWLTKIGAVRGTGSSDLEIIDQIVNANEVNLVYDATAEIGVQHFLSDISREREIPYLCVSTTSGGWGGIISRILPGRTQGCWRCLQIALNEGLIPSPPSSPVGSLQPIGCADPTFTGAGIDVEQIALAGVRLGISTLLTGRSGGYPDVDWDVAVISMRDSQGAITTPHFETFHLDRQLSCVCSNT